MEHPRERSRYIQEASEESAVALQCDAQVFGRDVVSALPLLFERCTFGGEALGELLHRGGHQLVGLLDRAAWLIDKLRLDVVPARAHLGDPVFREERRGTGTILNRAGNRAQ